MPKGADRPTKNRNVAANVRHRVLRGGSRVWRFEDFRDLPVQAVAQTLSRLARTGVLERRSKGVYYRPRPTPLGPSQLNPSDLPRLAAQRTAFFPAGLAAAHHLGFTTQVLRHPEVATAALSLPRKLVGAEMIIHTRRPAVWATLSAEDAALLDFLRRRGQDSELSAVDTVRRTLRMIAQPGRFNRLAHVVTAEPPRVRAMLGAIGQELGADAAVLGRLRKSLNPVSRFDFGPFAELPSAAQWQAAPTR